MTKPVRILLVEDNRQDVVLFRILLRKASTSMGVALDCDEAAGGAPALRLLADRRYDIVFLDQQMPGMDGLQTFKRLKELKQPPEYRPKVVIYSNCDLKEFQRECDVLGTDGFATKYLRPLELAAILQEQLGMEAAEPQWERSKSPG